MDVCQDVERHGHMCLSDTSVADLAMKYDIVVCASEPLISSSGNLTCITQQHDFTYLEQQSTEVSVGSVQDLSFKDSSHVKQYFATFSCIDCSGSARWLCVISNMTTHTLSSSLLKFL